MFEFKNTADFAYELDRNDSLAKFRDQFHIPQVNGKDAIYLCGNSLGLQPKSTAEYINQELSDWANLGVEGHLHAKNPWMPYHEYLSVSMAKIVGAKSSEVVVMNTLSANLHLMMVSFYRPSAKRNKILIESDAFPSDRYAVESQIRFHGFDPEECLLELSPRKGEHLIRWEDIEERINSEGEQIALIMLGNTNYYTGQRFDIQKITRLGHQMGCVVGFDCAHGAGNVPLDLHDNEVDFAVWCTYKYLNSGPGSVAALFVHEKHHTTTDIPRFNGWWGHNKSTRFGMRDQFDPIPSAEAWQLSNPPILSLAAILASLKVFDEAGFSNLREKSMKLTAFMEFLLQDLSNDLIEIITPKVIDERGAQLSLLVKKGGKALFDTITSEGVIADWREPNVIRIAPTALYNRFIDVYKFCEILKSQLVTA